MSRIRQIFTVTDSALRTNSLLCGISRTHLASPNVLTTTPILPRRKLSRLAPVPVRQDRLAEFTKDEEVDTSTVQIKKPDGKLSEPQSLRLLLRDIDRETQVVIQRSKPGERDAAVVEVCDRVELLKTIKDKEEIAKQHARSQRDQKPKQIEMNWAIGTNDLELKLRQLEQFVEKGKKVEILLAAKKRQRRASEDEAKEVLKKIKDKISELGAKELVPMEGALLKQATLTVKRVSA